MENCGGIIPGGPGGKPGGGIKGAAGRIGGTKVDAIFGVPGGNPGSAGGIPSFDALKKIHTEKKNTFRLIFCVFKLSLV